MAKDETTTADTHPLDAFAGAEKPRRRAGRVVGAVAAVVIVVAAGYVGASWALADTVPRGVTVAGVDIGGQQAEVAVATLTEELRAVTTEPIVVTAGESSVSLDPVVAGLTFDADATVDALTGFTLEPARLWQHLFGLGEQPPVTRVERTALDAAVATAGVGLLKDPVDGRIVFADGAAHASAAEQGIALDERAAAELLRRTWLTAPRPVELPTLAVAPTITQEETDRALAQLAKPLASGPVGVVVEGQVAELPVGVITAAATIFPEGDMLQLRLDGEQLVDEILKRTTDLLSDAEDARFEFVKGKPTIVAGTAGSTLDPEHVAMAVRNAALGSPRTANVVLTPVDPDQTTKALEELGITELVSTFDTPLTNDSVRTKNLIRGAELVTGVLVEPGETFSLNDTIGPITAENGYFDSTVVVNGVIQPGIGGGLSQMGTTMFNAAYFAGFEDVEHRPHTYWFSRYPEGREATIYEGAIDVKWKNTTPYGALLRSYVKDNRIYVEVWGTKHFEVQTSKSARSRIVAPTTRYSQAAGCISQSAGNPGFQVTNTRILLLEGEQVEKKSFTWSYNPQDAIVCGPKPKDD
ncbi:MAG: VanW family protein [Actinomycetales bacterium]|nr:VanW family protein [Actinomycetales bacterium]